MRRHEGCCKALRASGGIAVIVKARRNSSVGRAQPANVDLAVVRSAVQSFVLGGLAGVVVTQPARIRRNPGQSPHCTKMRNRPPPPVVLFRRTKMAGTFELQSALCEDPGYSPGPVSAIPASAMTSCSDDVLNGVSVFAFRTRSSSRGHAVRCGHFVE